MPPNVRTTPATSIGTRLALERGSACLLAKSCASFRDSAVFSTCSTVFIENLSQSLVGLVNAKNLNQATVPLRGFGTEWSDPIRTHTRTGSRSLRRRKGLRTLVTSPIYASKKKYQEYIFRPRRVFSHHAPLGLPKVSRQKMTTRRS